MKFIVFAIIAGVAAVIAYTALTPQCAGTVVQDQAQCERTSGFDRAFCARAFATTTESIRRAGIVFKTHAECSERHRVCVEYPGVHGWTPRPAGYCIAREAAGNPVLTPTYDR